MNDNSDYVTFNRKNMVPSHISRVLVMSVSRCWYAAAHLNTLKQVTSAELSVLS